MTGSYNVLADGSSIFAGAGAVAIPLILIGLYWLPSIVGGTRHVRNLGSVAVINAFLGWTVVGWVVALAMAVRSQEPRPQGYMPPSGPPQWGHPGQPPWQPTGQPPWPLAPRSPADPAGGTVPQSAVPAWPQPDRSHWPTSGGIGTDLAPGFTEPPPA
jgi:hypothetical protein